MLLIRAFKLNVEAPRGMDTRRMQKQKTTCEKKVEIKGNNFAPDRYQSSHRSR